ncbi:MAG: hypothetical protein JWQ02_3533 [Capsulimonas sp.]|nr:hypothetical protein [Capsulimonas sp.]
MESQVRPKIQCPRHGASEYSLVCRHLRLESGRSYYACKNTPHAPAQAWCALCDEVLCAEQGWTERACGVADWQITCAECCSASLARHNFLTWSVGTDEPQ